MITASPAFAITLGLLLLIFIWLGKIWSAICNKKDQPNPSLRDHNIVYLGIRGIFLLIYVSLGLNLFLYAFTMCAPGMIQYVTCIDALEAIILSMILGGIVIVGIALLAPTWKTLLSFLAMFITVLYYFFYSTAPPTEALYIPLLVGFIVEIISNLLDFTRILLTNSRSLNLNSNTEKINFRDRWAQPLWDISEKFNQFFSNKFLAVLLIIYYFEFFVVLDGWSITSWIRQFY